MAESAGAVSTGRPAALTAIEVLMEEARGLYRQALLRPLLTVTALMLLYYTLPLDRKPDLRLILLLSAGVLAVVGLGVWQVHAILRSRYPGAQAVLALAVAVPLFLLLFAATDHVMSSAAPDAFTQPLSRTDALYFTVTSSPPSGSATSHR
jgi:voltage-gated potassium channel